MNHPQSWIANFSALNALVAVGSGVVTAVVGIWQARRQTRENLNQTIDEYATLNNVKDERIEELEKSMRREEERNLQVSRRLGVLEGQNKYLMEERILLEQYCQQLRTLCLRAGVTVPGRPQLDMKEEGEL
jgi:hypothetical protein